MRGSVEEDQWLRNGAGGEGVGGVRGVLDERGERGEGGPSMTTTFSLRVLLRGGSPKNADINRPSERLFFLDLGLSSSSSINEGRPEEVEDRGGVLSRLIINSEVGSP